jgi:hypothetical protein
MAIEVHKSPSGWVERIVSSDCSRTPRFWLASTGRLHRVQDMTLIWKGPNTSWRHPRFVVTIFCHHFFNPRLMGLTNESRNYELCCKCFPLGRKDPNLSIKSSNCMVLDGMASKHLVWV